VCGAGDFMEIPKIVYPKVDQEDLLCPLCQSHHPETIQHTHVFFCIYPQSILNISSSVVHDFQIQAAIMRGLPLSLWRTTKHNFPWYFPSSFPLTLLLLFPLGLGVSETLPLAFLSFDGLPFLGQNYSDSSYMRGTFNMSNFTTEVVASLDEKYNYLFYVHGWKYVSKSTTEILNRISNKKISS